MGPIKLADFPNTLVWESGLLVRHRPMKWLPCIFSRPIFRRMRDLLGYVPALMRKPGIRLQRDRTRLLLGFKRRKTLHDLDSLLSNTAFQAEDIHERQICVKHDELLEQSASMLCAENCGQTRRDLLKQAQQACGGASDGSSETVGGLQAVGLPEKASHSSRRFWVESRDAQPIDQTGLDELILAAGSELGWIGPVYRLPHTPGRAGLFCPLPHVLVIKPAERINEEALLSTLEALHLQEMEMRSRYGGGNRYFRLTDGSPAGTVYDLPRRLKQQPTLIQEAWFENVFLLSSVSAGSFTPRDEYYLPNDSPYDGYPGQWNWDRIQAEGGWATLKKWEEDGNAFSPVIICILDEEGLELGHPEFKERITKACTIELDAPDHADLPPGQGNPTDTHGTMCAGIALAELNSRGVAGLAGTQNFSIMPVLTDGSLRSWAAGIRYAADNGARVISLSMTAQSAVLPESDVRDLDAAIDYAVNTRYVVICASAGNENNPELSYPARLPDVIACGALNRKESKRCDYPGDWGSNYGDNLSVVAPGVLIPTTNSLAQGYYKKGYAFTFEGTSAAAPHVAGLAALLLSVDSSLTPGKIRDIIERTATKVNEKNQNGGVYDYNQYRAKPGWNEEVGYGLINVQSALESVTSNGI